MKRFKVLFFACALAFAWLGWVQVSNSFGDQTVSYQPAKKECFSAGSSTPWRYCVYTAAQGTNGGVAYVLHGRNLDENIWNDDTYYTALIQEYWSRKKMIPPTIVTVSFGPVWLLAPQGQSKKSGLLELFQREVIPQVEARIGKPRYRDVLGDSMGGLNTLLLALHSKGTFKKAIALCPGVYRDSPFTASWREYRDFFRRTGADPKIILGVVLLAKQYATSEDEWKQISPIDLLNTVSPSDVPEIYLSCGLYDKYGNYEGSELFSEKAEGKGIKVEWRPLYGGHCAIDVVSVAESLL